MRALALFACLTLTILCGCSNNNFREVFQLGTLRVLSLQLSVPEVNPGDTTTLTPLISDLSGNGRALTYSVEICTDPGINSGAPATCAGQSDDTKLVTGASVPALTAPNYLGTAPTTNIPVPTTVLNNRTPVDQYNGVGYLVFYTLTASDGTSVTALKRIYVSNKTPKNQNPTMTSILINGNPITSLPVGLVTLSATVSAGSDETYTYQFPDGSSETLTEDLITTWYISDGDLDQSETQIGNGDYFTPPTHAPTGHSLIIVGVTRDQRGGESSLIVTVP